MIEIELSGNSYRLGKLTAFGQFHVSRKLAPVIPALIPMLSAVSKGDLEKAMEGDGDALAKSAEPLAQALAAMPDDHAEYVIGSCLSMVSRKQGDGWYPVWANGVAKYDDMDLDVILPLVVRVIRESLGGFIQGLVTKATASPAQA